MNPPDIPSFTEFDGSAGLPSSHRVSCAIPQVVNKTVPLSMSHFFLNALLSILYTPLLWIQVAWFCLCNVWVGSSILTGLKWTQKQWYPDISNHIGSRSCLLFGQWRLETKQIRTLIIIQRACVPCTVINFVVMRIAYWVISGNWRCLPLPLAVFENTVWRESVSITKNPKTDEWWVPNFGFGEFNRLWIFLHASNNLTKFYVIGDIPTHTPLKRQRCTTLICPEKPTKEMCWND